MVYRYSLTLKLFLYIFILYYKITSERAGLATNYPHLYCYLAYFPFRPTFPDFTNGRVFAPIPLLNLNILLIKLPKGLSALDFHLCSLLSAQNYTYPRSKTLKNSSLISATLSL